MAIPAELEQLLAGNQQLWRADGLGEIQLPALPTGHAALDAALPGGGWPIGALTELIVPHWGIGELRLLSPAWRAMTQARRWLAWIAPPYVPYAPALLQVGVDLRYTLLIEIKNSHQDLFWCMERLLRNPAAGIVMAWPRSLQAGNLRRLQLAAETGHSLGVLFHQRAIESTPAALRLQLNPAQPHLEITILKARGSLLRPTVLLSV